MTASELLRQICSARGVSMSELARRLGQSRQNLYKKMKNNTLSAEELLRSFSVMDIRMDLSMVCSEDGLLRYEIKDGSVRKM